MQISARNQLKAKIESIKNGPVSTEVTLNVGGQKMVSVITTESAILMGLKTGDDVSALVKASNVMLMK